MYCNVPKIVPCAVSGSLHRREVPKLALAGAASCFNLAKPKSSSFVPDFVSMMLPGFRSRWVTPLRCALSSASEISMAYCKTCWIGSGPFTQALREGLAFEIFHHQEIDVVLMAGVVEGADVRMVQAGDGFCFAVEALAQFGAVGEMSGKNLDGDDAIEARIAGLVHFAHSARADRGDNFVRAEFCASGEHYLFSFAAQFKTTVIGSTSASLTSVLIRNRWPSLLTS